ncbi:MAG: hypothetical protein LBP53_07925 [Candidatus Peribacteria bacterium]|jgi:hypothetical protein|nr:hypothetical protein [Candidatus Peribacteria bacterium]
MNQATISVVLQSTDKEPPYVVREQSKVLASEAEKSVTLIFNDHLSAVVGGEIFAGGTKLTSFLGRLATFTTTADTIEVIVKDAYENTLKETINLTEW